MAGGSFLSGPFACVGWPTAEMGGMGLEGAVKLGFRKELAAAKGEDKKELYDSLVTQGSACRVPALYSTKRFSALPRLSCTCSRTVLV